jgi:dTDP-glucose 4,6-dehydratase
MENLEITRRVLSELGKPASLIRYVDDRPGHDRRYSLDAGKLARLGFSPRTPLEEGLSRTIRWYREHADWWRPVKEKDAAYRAFYRTQYAERLATSTAHAKPAG